MSPRRKQRDSFVQSLFPFLAVLLSTMGALVLLLMLIVNQAQATAKQMATEKKMQIEDAEAKLDILRSSFEEKLGDSRLEIERKRLTLQHLEKHIAELIDELKSLERTATLLDSKQTQDKESEEEKNRTISELEKQLADANVNLKKKLDNPEGNKPIFAIIPYQGTNGTHRRPIYLECIDKGVIIQPEGVLIGIADLRPPYGPGNPLDAAIRTVRSQFAPANGALTSTAYPLLVVRPSGVRTYAMARQAMSGWDDQFGYELIDEQLELTFPESESGVAAEIEKALVLARERQAALVMAMPAKFRQYINQDGASEADDRLDFADDGGDLGDEWAGGGPAGSSGGVGSGSGDGSRAGSGSGAGTGSGGSQGFRGGVATAQNGSGGTSGLRGTGAGAGGTGAGMSNGQSPSGSGELGFAGTGTGGQATAGQPGAGGLGANGQPGGTSYFADGGNGQTGAGEGSYFASGNGGSTGGDASGFGGGTAGGAGGSGGDGSLAESSSRNGAGGSSTSGAAGNNAGGSGASGSGAGGAGGGGAGPGGPAGMLGGSSSTAPSGGGGAGAASMGGMNSMAGDPANDPTASPNGDPSQPMGAPSLNMDMTRNSNQAGQAGQQSEPVARQRGRNWAWSEGPPSKTAVVRTIRVVCYEDRWVLMQDNAASNQVTIQIGRSPQQSAERLAKAITDRVSGWGIALGGGYWKPELVVDIAPGAEARCAQLERLLEGSGLTVKRRTAK